MPTFTSGEEGWPRSSATFGADRYVSNEVGRAEGEDLGRDGPVNDPVCIRRAGTGSLMMGGQVPRLAMLGLVAVKGMTD